MRRARLPVLEFTSYISPDGEEFKFDQGMQRWLMTEEGLGMPPIEYITQKSPFQDGETIIGYRLKPRTIQMQIRSDSAERDAYWEARADLLNVLRPNRSIASVYTPGILRKAFGDQSIREIKVVLGQGPAFAARSLDRWDELGFTETIRFIAHDPMFYDPNESIYIYSSLTDPDVNNLVLASDFPFIIGLDNVNHQKAVRTYGNYKTFPTITIWGPINQPEIHNDTTNETIKLLYSVASGEIVTIYLTEGYKHAVSSSGLDLSGALSGDDIATFHLEPDPKAVDGWNHLWISSDFADPQITTSTMIYFSFFNRFIGI